MTGPRLNPRNVGATPIVTQQSGSNLAGLTQIASMGLDLYKHQKALDLKEEEAHKVALKEAKEAKVNEDLNRASIRLQELDLASAQNPNITTTQLAIEKQRVLLELSRDNPEAAQGLLELGMSQAGGALSKEINEDKEAFEDAERQRITVERNAMRDKGLNPNSESDVDIHVRQIRDVSKLADLQTRNSLRDANNSLNYNDKKGEHFLKYSLMADNIPTEFRSTERAAEGKLVFPQNPADVVKMPDTERAELLGEMKAQKSRLLAGMRADAQLRNIKQEDQTAVEGLVSAELDIMISYLSGEMDADMYQKKVDTLKNQALLFESGGTPEGLAWNNRVKMIFNSSNPDAFSEFIKATGKTPEQEAGRIFLGPAFEAVASQDNGEAITAITNKSAKRQAVEASVNYLSEYLNETKRGKWSKDEQAKIKSQMEPVWNGVFGSVEKGMESHYAESISAVVHFMGDSDGMGLLDSVGFERIKAKGVSISKSFGTSMVASLGDILVNPDSGRIEHSVTSDEKGIITIKGEIGESNTSKVRQVKAQVEASIKAIMLNTDADASEALQFLMDNSGFNFTPQVVEDEIVGEAGQEEDAMKKVSDAITNLTSLLGGGTANV